jgi:hypothetical protein
VPLGQALSPSVNTSSCTLAALSARSTLSIRLAVVAAPMLLSHPDIAGTDQDGGAAQGHVRRGRWRAGVKSTGGAHVRATPSTMMSAEKSRISTVRSRPVAGTP